MEMEELDIEKLFNDLESANPQLCENAKRILTDIFNQTSSECENSKRALTDLFNQRSIESLVKEMMEYYRNTNSQSIVDVLVKVQRPHCVYIFERLSEWLRMKGNSRVQALTLFGMIVRKHPTWLVNVTQNKLINNIIKILMKEDNIVPLMSALLCIITLLPIIPSLVPKFLNELFDVFGHLASWNCKYPNTLSEDKLIHLQLGLHMLFHRLYGMYPMKFIAYLRVFISREKGPIFQHTIKPLLETVRVHPLLLTSSEDNELNGTRWMEMEPHDVVEECAKLSLYVFRQDHRIEGGRSNPRLLPPGSYTPRSIDSIKDQSSQRTLKTCDRLSSPFQSLMDNGKNFDYQQLNALRSPLKETLATPPPTSTITHTPTQFYGLPPTDSSPPEAAVEATPETTPLKDIKPRRSNPHAVRALLGPNQPLSPMKKDHSPFSFPSSGETVSQKFVQMVNDRKASQLQLQASRLDNQTPQPDDQHVQAPTKEDQEVLQLTSLNQAKDKPHNSSQCLKCDETEQKPCSVGGLQVATARNVRHLAKVNKRNRMVSYCHNDSNPVPPPSSKIRRSKSCPLISNEYPEVANDFARKQITKTTLAPKSNVLAQIITKTLATQTIHSWPPAYEYSLLELLNEDSKIRSSFQASEMRPQEILNQFIERTIRSKHFEDVGQKIESMEEQLQLLYLQLQYERYRREIHAERNRRLMGRSREIRSLEMKNDNLLDQLRCFQKENETLESQLNTMSKNSIEREHQYLEENNVWKTKYQSESEDNKQLRLMNENLQKRLTEEMQKRKELNNENEELRGDIFDLRNELQHAQYDALMGMQCKQELTKLETELMVIGEVQIKCRDRILDERSVLAKDEELRRLQEAYSAEIADLKSALGEKTSELDSAKYRLNELQSQLVNKETLFTDQKRKLKSVKDEYEEKFKALTKKYDVQKAIILQMEQKILEYQKNSAAQNSIVLSPESDRTDFPSSIDRTSPLSTSLASSDGLSSSLRSVTELRNLQALVSPPPPLEATPAPFPQTSRRSSTSSSSNQPLLNVNLPTTSTQPQRHANPSSLDIPVPRVNPQHAQTNSNIHHFPQNR